MKFLPDQLKVVSLADLAPGDFYRIVGSDERATVPGVIVSGRTPANRRIERHQNEWASVPIAGDAYNPTPSCIKLTPLSQLKIKIPENARTAAPSDASGGLMITGADAFLLVKIEARQLVQISLRTWETSDYDPRYGLAWFNDWQLVEEVQGAEDIVYWPPAYE